MRFYFKALAEYLETKRLAFPRSVSSLSLRNFSLSNIFFTRFYFSSSADLLDILSKGNQPQMVAKHLTKLFDSMAKLIMEEDGEGKATNTAHTMVAKDGEKVLFKVACICEGQVEVWLNRLMSCMRETIR